MTTTPTPPGALAEKYIIACDAVCEARNRWHEDHEAMWLDNVLGAPHLDDFVAHAVVDALAALPAERAPDTRVRCAYEDCEEDHSPFPPPAERAQDDTLDELRELAASVEKNDCAAIARRVRNAIAHIERLEREIYLLKGNVSLEKQRADQALEKLDRRERLIERAQAAADLHRRANEVLHEIDAQWDQADPENDPESIVACLGDDATEMLYANPEDERAINMFRAAKWIEHNAPNSDEFGCGSAADERAQAAEPVACVRGVQLDYLNDDNEFIGYPGKYAQPGDLLLYTHPAPETSESADVESQKWEGLAQSFDSAAKEIRRDDETGDHENSAMVFEQCAAKVRETESGLTIYLADAPPPASADKVTDAMVYEAIKAFEGFRPDYDTQFEQSYIESMRAALLAAIGGQS